MELGPFAGAWCDWEEEEILPLDGFLRTVAIRLFGLPPGPLVGAQVEDGEIVLDLSNDDEWRSLYI